MRYCLALVLMLLASTVGAQDWEDRRVFGDDTPDVTLRVISSTDTDLFAPVVSAFLARNDGIAVEYLVTGTADMDLRFRADPAGFDIAISSAMDLQFKLANDGFALPLAGVSHPAWAAWRQSLFAFTSEPAAIVINRAAFDGHPVPRTRQDLIAALRARPAFFQNRVGTYDVRRSGLGYLFATQDARATETFWRLMEVMGRLDVRLYCCSGEMIDDLTKGELAVAYNVLGSYAAARVESQTTLEIILPSDFPTTMMRTALVSRQTTAPDVAERFIRHLVAWQAESGATSLPPLHQPTSGKEQATIALEPALMTFLDSLKRRKFISEWEDALIQQ